MDFIRLGDTTTGDGVVISASEAMMYDGRKLARKGDRVTCMKHPRVNPNVIIEGDASMKDEGIPLARHLYRVTCGCQVISSLC
ncbi:PAAR domain-containing protein [Cupriavidus agavae]|uniref:Putative Zn-binding protein involved in type VI secretion n=1 Tax=Cupriavidus agavae TaxID=1001822 RepID=A0A4V2FGH1_9BURK|nr:PAAR domain-containing protein [Cupriavidus agavae]RZT36759.1 putative Zn-binding protein involved in type VI secretion [Cupriavidus agavae]